MSNLLQEVLESEEQVCWYNSDNIILSYKESDISDKNIILGKHTRIVHRYYLYVGRSMPFSVELIISKEELSNIINHNIKINLKQIVTSLFNNGTREKEVLDVVSKIYSDLSIKEIIC